MVIENFYDAAYLLNKNYIITLVEKDERGKKIYHFANDDDDETMTNDIKEFRNNKVLQSYINSIIMLRNINKIYYRKWDNE